MKFISASTVLIVALLVISTLVSIQKAKEDIRASEDDFAQKSMMPSVWMGIATIDTYRITGDHVKARAMGKSVLATLSTLKGDNDHLVGMCHWKLALLDVSEGVPGFGREHYDLALRKLGDRHADLRDKAKAEYARELTAIGKAELIPRQTK